MRTLQEKTEELVYDVINEISDELEIKVKRLPEVYYVHRGFPFEKLGLPEYVREDFEFVKKHKNGIYFYLPRIILIPNQNKHEIFEEATHFIHFNQSKLNFKNKDQEEIFSLNAIIEMLGYFGSKFGNPKIKPPYQDYPDIIKERKKCLEIIKKKKLTQEEFFRYQQGYGLGEKLFNSYIAGIVSKKQIRNLMSKKFEEPYGAIVTLTALKTSFFNFLEKNF